MSCTFLVEVDTNPAVGDVVALLLAAPLHVLPPVMVVDHGRSTVLLRTELRLEEEPILRIHMPTDGRHIWGMTDG